MQLRVPHGRNGPDGLDHMADHVDDGQVDDGPAEQQTVITRPPRLCTPAVALTHLSPHRATREGEGGVPNSRMAGNSLELPEPGVGDESSQHRREIAEAAEGVVDGRGEVLVPFQVGEEVKRQHR